MTRHYLTVAMRNLGRDKIFSFINLSGLSVGLACFFLFLMYLVNETSYDQFNRNGKDIYRVYESSKSAGGNDYTGDAMLYLPLGPALQKDLPDVKSFVRLAVGNKPAYLEAGDKKIKLPVTYSDASIFSMFSFKIVEGSRSAALNNRNSVALTKTNARLLFGDENAVGQTLNIKTDQTFEPFVVSAVVEDIPSNSSVSFNLLLSMAYFEATSQGKSAVDSWNYSGFQTYVLLNEKSNLAAHPQTLVPLRKKYFPDEQAQLIKAGLWNGQGTPPVSFQLQPLSDIHTNDRISGGQESHTIDVKGLWTLFAIAVAILIIGCINFTTLAIGRSSKRAKEIGVRKVIGGRKPQLMFQFLLESLLLSCIAGALAIIIAWLLLPTFNNIVDVRLSFSLFHYKELSVFFMMLLLICGLLAGLYPAAILSNIDIIKVLKSRVRLNGSNAFTKTLVVVQYVLSIALIIGAAVVVTQVKYMKTMDIGFNKENVVAINAEGVNGSRVYPIFREMLRGNPNIVSVTSSAGAFGNNYNASGFDYQNKHHQVVNFSCDTNFLSVMRMRLIAGRNLDAQISADTTNSAIVNEAFVKDMGLSNNDVLGLQLSGYSAHPKDDPVVVGVVSDFNLLPVKERIAPILFRHKNRYNPSVFYVRIRQGNASAALRALVLAWEKSTKENFFDYSFLDEDLNRNYLHESKLSSIVISAAAICIFLAILGIGSLAHLSSQNRIRELVIRKILGSSLSNILYLMLKDWLQLALLAFVIAAPITWYFLQKWLNNYASRVSINAWTFVVCGLAIVLFSLAVVSATIMKAATMRPSGVLKSE